MSEKLLPCPFCGGKAGRADNELGTTIVCDNDDCIVSAYSAAGQPEDAVAAWNTRHGDAPQAPEPVAEVLYYNPSPHELARPRKIIDASLAFMDSAPIGTKLYAEPPAPRMREPDGGPLAFEKAIREIWSNPGYAFPKEGGEYAEYRVRTLWRVWQAARAAPPPQSAASTVEPVPKMGKREFIQAISDADIRTAFERREYDLESQRGYNDRLLPSFELNWDGSMYATGWLQAKFYDFAAGYREAAWLACNAGPLARDDRGGPDA